MSLHGSVRTTNHSELRNMLSQPTNGKKLQLIKGSYCDKLNCSWCFKIQNTSVLGSIQVKLNRIDPSQRPTRLHYCFYVRQAMVLSRHTSCEWKIHHRVNRTTHRQKRQRLSFQMKSIFISKTKYCFIALWYDMTDRCSTSVQAAHEAIISSSLLVIAWYKHEWPSDGILFQLQKDISTHHFSSSSPLT